MKSVTYRWARATPHQRLDSKQTVANGSIASPAIEPPAFAGFFFRGRYEPATSVMATQLVTVVFWRKHDSDLGRLASRMGPIDGSDQLARLRYDDDHPRMVDREWLAVPSVALTFSNPPCSSQPRSSVNGKHADRNVESSRLSATDDDPLASGETGEWTVRVRVEQKSRRLVPTGFGCCRRSALLDLRGESARLKQWSDRSPTGGWPVSCLCLRPQCSRWPAQPGRVRTRPASLFGS